MFMGRCLFMHSARYGCEMCNFCGGCHRLESVAMGQTAADRREGEHTITRNIQQQCATLI